MIIQTDLMQEHRKVCMYQRLEGQHIGSVIALLNSPIVTGKEGIFVVDTLYDPKSVLRELQKADLVISCIGHFSTAKVLSMLLGITIPVNRVQYEQLEGETVLSLTLNDRLPEGVSSLTVEEIEAIGYSWKRIRKYPRNPFA